jgi:uncharacterized protein (DUF1697 family)
MTRWVVLLRGVNVGGRGRLAMADLRAVAERVGFTDVATYVQSGNLVGGWRGNDPVSTIHDALAADLGCNADVVTRDADAWHAIVATNPYGDAAATNGTHVHVALSQSVIDPALGGLDAARFAPEALWCSGREMYLHLPGGMGRSPLATALAKVKGGPSVTVRNWNTVTALDRLLR